MINIVFINDVVFETKGCLLQTLQSHMRKKLGAHTFTV